MNSIIPMSKDVAGFIGYNAENVENRSLLLDKFIVPKSWIHDGPKADEASRWSLLRLSKSGIDILRKELQNAQNAAQKTNRAGEAARFKIPYLESLVCTRQESPDSQTLRAKHTAQFIRLVQSSSPKDSCVLCAKLESRLAINLSDGLIQNAGISLDRIFGLPLIHGSALKGCARHAALAELKKVKSEAPDLLPDLLTRFVAVFGCCSNDFKGPDSLLRFGSIEDLGKLVSFGDQKGGITFLPASPIGPCDLEVDITNVHTPDYYTGRDAGSIGALRNESPKPNPFPTVKAGTVFGFALLLNSIGLKNTNKDQVLSDAKRWLTNALTIQGIGAKTGSGYGWFSLDNSTLENVMASLAKETMAKAEALRLQTEKRVKQEAEQARLAAMSPLELAIEKISKMDDPTFADIVNRLRELDPMEQKAVLMSCNSHKSVKLKNWRKSKKGTDQQRVKLITELSNELGVSLK